jgi:hypothetical protein
VADIAQEVKKSAEQSKRAITHVRQAKQRNRLRAAE